MELLPASSKPFHVPVAYTVGASLVVLSLPPAEIRDGTPITLSAATMSNAESTLSSS